MTQEELKKKIDGLFFGLHSTNPGDVYALPEILNELMNMAGQGGGGTVVKLTAPFDDQSDYTKAQMAELIGVSESDIDVIMEGAADTILEVTQELSEKGTDFTRKSFLRAVYSDDFQPNKYVIYASWDGQSNYFRLMLAKKGDEYSIESTYASGD